MRFERLIGLKTVLSSIYDKLSLQSEINNNIFSISSVMADAEFDQNFFVTSYQKLLNDDHALVSKFKQAIEKIEQLATNDGLMLSNDPNYNSIFSEGNVHTATGGLNSSAHSEVILKNTIAKYISWQHPALCLHCRDTTINRIDYLVAGDPLYLAGANIETLQGWINKYPTLYQRRIRIYEIAQNDATCLPQNQFGFVFCWEFFNLITVDRIDTHIKIIMSLLKPGGVTMFSYTNADLEITARLVDNRLFPWASKKYINQLLVSAGFEIIAFVDLKLENGTYISWAEARKPGENRSMKRNQPMGQIHQK